MLLSKLINRLKAFADYLRAEQAAQDAAIADLQARGRRVDGGGVDAVHAPGGGVNGGGP